MRLKVSPTSTDTPPTVIGTGLIALDVLVNGGRKDIPRLWTGGTCGNVLTILSFLGWRAFPIARLANDSASEFVKKDLARWNVRLDYTSLKPRARVPIIIQHLTQTSAGLPLHRFSWTCPACGTWLPTYRAVVDSTITAALPRIKRAQVFFFDRVSRSALTLAKKSAAEGALIFFEPSCSQDPELFKEALRLTHILKYSHERSRKLRPLMTKTNQSPLLEIETLGAEGLRFRCQLRGYDSTRWQRLEAYELRGLRDPSGAGDWCTAGLIYRLGRGGHRGFRITTRRDLQDALAFSQALAAWTCRYEGARGGMYLTDHETFFQEVDWIMSGKAHNLPYPEIPSEIIRSMFEGLCTGCEEQTQKRPSTIN